MPAKYFSASGANLRSSGRALDASILEVWRGRLIRGCREKTDTEDSDISLAKWFCCSVCKTHSSLSVTCRVWFCIRLEGEKIFWLSICRKTSSFQNHKPFDWSVGHLRRSPIKSQYCYAQLAHLNKLITHVTCHVKRRYFFILRYCWQMVVCTVVQ